MFTINDTTLLVANYMRPANVIKIIERFQGFLPITLINNNPSYHVPKNFYSGKIYNNSRNKGDIDRWYRALECQTEYICFVADTFLPYKKTILDLRKTIKKFPDSIIGTTGNVQIVEDSCFILRVQTIKKTYIKDIELNNLCLAITQHFGVSHYIMDTEMEILPDYGIERRS